MWNVDKILKICEKSARIALKWYENPPMELKSDNSVVTVADKEVEAFLISELCTGNDSYFIGEETVSDHSEEYIQAALRADYCWIVDPIDGTAPYSCTFPAWGHSVALMEKGVITNGAIYLPIQDVMLITDGNKVWHISNLRDSAKTVKTEFNFPDTTVDVRRPIAVAQRYAKYHRLNFDNQIFSWSGCVAASYYTITGKLMAYLAVVKLWDIAAVGAIISKGNFTGINEFGKIFDCRVNNENYILSPDTPDRWRLLGATCFAGNREICDYLFNRIDKGTK